MKSILASLLATTFALCTLLNTGTAQVPSFPPCPGCQTTDVTYVAVFDGVLDPSFDGGPHSEADGTTIMVSITNPASGKCWQIPKIVDGEPVWVCVDEAPCAYRLQWSFNVGTSGGSATGKVIIEDGDDAPGTGPNDVSLEETWSGPAGTGDSGDGRVQAWCNSNSYYTLRVTSNSGHNLSIDASLGCGQCGS